MDFSKDFLKTLTRQISMALQDTHSNTAILAIHGLIIDGGCCAGAAFNVCHKFLSWPLHNGSLFLSLISQCRKQSNISAAKRTQKLEAFVSWPGPKQPRGPLQLLSSGCKVCTSPALSEYYYICPAMAHASTFACQRVSCPH